MSDFTPIEIGSRRELFVDDKLIESSSALCRQLQRPIRRDVAITLNAPWEANNAGFLSVFKDHIGAIRLYYRAECLEDVGDYIERYAVAISSDGGIHFERPDLGRVEFMGSRANNILAVGDVPCVPAAFLDSNPNGIPERRYKGFTAKLGELYAMHSADGVEWHPSHDGPVNMVGRFDTINTAFWDHRTACYRAFTRYMPGYGPTDRTVPEIPIRRSIQSSTSADFTDWTDPVYHRYPDDYGDLEFYTNGTLLCPGAEHIYLAFPNRIQEDRIFNPDHPYPGVNDAMFMASRDGVEWTRYPEAWVRPGLDVRNWTERNIYPVWGIVETSDDEWSMYVSEHFRQPDVPVQLRRLSLRPHGFVALHADFTPGECLTKPILMDGDRLHINYSTSALGGIRVELTDADGQVMPGFSMAECGDIFGDELERTVRWGEAESLTALRGQPLRLRFHLKDADLFTFQFR